MAEQYGRLDPWSETAAIGAAKANEMASRLEQRARLEDEGAARAAYLDLLEIGRGSECSRLAAAAGSSCASWRGESHPTAWPSASIHPSFLF